jgi:hypothetical protein
MVIPHQSLHALSGTISLALRSHGLNFGVSGGPGNLAEGLLAAVAVLSEGALPGLWLVLTAWDVDPVLDDQGNPTTPAVCRGVALALEPVGPECPAPRLVVRPADAELAAGDATLAGLAEFLTTGGPVPWVCPIPWGGCVELTGTIGATEARP